MQVNRSKLFGGMLTLIVASLLAFAGTASAAHHQAASRLRHVEDPGLGPNVIVFDPSMPQSAIQTTLNTIATQQVPNQFGPQRYAILFKPGTYGSASDPLIFQVGYYTAVAGLGAQPGDVTINGAIDVFNQCVNNNCDGTNNFWRSLSNLTLNVTLPKVAPVYQPATGENQDCDNSNEMWAVSQAAPMRRVIMNGTVTLQDYCGRGFVSGGFLADDEFNKGVVINAGQQQFFTRNSNLDGWTNGVWNQVFLGDNGAPATSFGPGTNQYTTLPTTPVSQEEPFLYTDDQGAYRVFVPAVRQDSVGPSYASGPAAGTSLPLERFFIADPSSSVEAINAALAEGRNLLLTPGVYHLDRPIEVRHPGTIVLGLGFPTLIPDRGNASMQTTHAPGIKLSGMIFDAGTENSPVLLQVGSGRGRFGMHQARDGGAGTWAGPRTWAGPGEPVGPGESGGEGESGGAGDPTLLQDIFFRIGGAEAGRATNGLIVNSHDAILDDVWAWRADHGAGAGWTTNPAATGVIVNGDGVRAYGLAVEHFQRYEVIWNGQNGEDVFFQNEMPYDPPSQSAWMASPHTDGYPAFLVTPRVRTFSGYGMGSYSFFNQGVPIYASEAFASPQRPGVNFQDLLTVFLDVNGSGGILSVINGVGGASTAANADKPVDVAAYP